MSENQRDPQYKLRWSEELREKIAQSAKEHNRSMNADIIARLEKSFDEPMIFNSEDKDSIAKIVALSMQTLIGELQEEGVKSETLAKAIHNMANKKAP